MLEITVEEALSEFLLAGDVNGKSANTILWYERILRGFREKYGHLSIRQVRQRQMLEYIVEIKHKGRYAGAVQMPEQPGVVSVRTVNGHVRALKAFWRWVAEHPDYGFDAGHSPVKGIKLQREPDDEPRANDPAELVLLMKACDASRQGRRDIALLAFLADTGARVGGVAGLRDDHLFLNEGYAILTEKGQRTRRVPFSPYTAGLISDWLDVRPGLGGAVFCNLARQPGAALTETGIYQALARLGKKAGVKGNVNPHSFRHGFALGFLENGGDSGVLSRLMGHKSINTTLKFYGKMTPQQLADAHQKFGIFSKKGGE